MCKILVNRKIRMIRKGPEGNTLVLFCLLLLAPADKLEGIDQEIFKERDRKLEEARELRRKKRQQASYQGNYLETAVIPLAQAA